MSFDELKQKAKELPLKPGVYIMQNRKNEVIYVGKAKTLRNRVSQYFQDSAGHSEKTRAMVAQIDHFDVIIAQSEFEALVLECALIKRHMPRYNILLKDSKGYPYIRLSAGDEYPVFSLSGKVYDDGARYFGPYGSRGATQNIIDTLRNALKLPSCARKFPRDIGKERPCLNYHMGLCDGYCRPEMEQSRYQESVIQAVRLLEGKYDEVADELRADMERAALELRFERAAELRDRLRAIELLGKRQKVVAGSLADTDVVGFHSGDAKSCFVMLHYLEGELAAKDWELVDVPLKEETDKAISSLIAQYYGGRSRLPRQILLPCELEDEAHLARMLSENGKHKVDLVAPRRGAKMDLIRLANENAAEEVERATTKQERQNKLLELLGHMLGLPERPVRIEAFDISNTGKDNIVASMTVFSEGKPLKRDYRRFILRGMEHVDDYASMGQVIDRRFKRYLEGDEKFGELPDLILVDGGSNHAAVALRTLEGHGLGVPVFGMVKDDRHRTRGLVTAEGREIGLQSEQSVFALIGRIQEETHRFAIEFQRERQAAGVKKSALDGIPGVGEKRKNQLLKHFKSIRNIKNASEEELCEAVPRNVAEAIHHYFHGGEKA